MSTRASTRQAYARRRPQTAVGPQPGTGPTRTRRWCLRSRPYTRSGARPADPPPRALRLRCVPTRAGDRGAGRRRGNRHARRDADGLGQVPHLPARGDAPPRADARPLTADRPDEGSGRQAASRDRGDGDLRQLLARRGRVCVTDRRRGEREDADPLRGARAAPAAAIRGDAQTRRDRARRDRRGALREHVGPRLPARLPVHPPGAREDRPALRARDDRDRHASHGSGDRRRARPRPRRRAHERGAPEPPLRRRGSGQRARAPRDPRRAAPGARRRHRDRLRALAPLLRGDRAHAARPRGADGALPRGPRVR